MPASVLTVCRLGVLKRLAVDASQHPNTRATTTMLRRAALRLARPATGNWWLAWQLAVVVVVVVAMVVVVVVVCVILYSCLSCCVLVCSGLARFCLFPAPLRALHTSPAALQVSPCHHTPSLNLQWQQ